MKLTLTLSNAVARVKVNFAIALSVSRHKQLAPQPLFRATPLRGSRALLAKLAGLRQSQKWIPTFRQTRTQYRVVFRFAARATSECRRDFYCAASVPRAAEHFR